MVLEGPRDSPRVSEVSPWHDCVWLQYRMRVHMLRIRYRFSRQKFQEDDVKFVYYCIPILVVIELQFCLFLMVPGT